MIIIAIIIALLYENSQQNGLLLSFEDITVTVLFIFSQRMKLFKFLKEPSRKKT